MKYTKTFLEEHNAKLEEVKRNPEDLLKNDINLVGGKILRRSVLVEREVDGLPVLAYPILLNGEDTGKFKVAWSSLMD